MMKRLYGLWLLVMCICASVQCAHAEDSAERVFSRVAERIKANKSTTIRFSIAQAGESTAGIITLSGNKFVITIGDLTTWYNGKTQWTYSRQAAECNITEPTASELAEINPFTILEHFRKDFTAAFGAAPAGKKKILLKAKNSDTEIARATMTVDAQTFAPEEITISPRSGQTVVIRVKKIEAGGRLSDAAFTFRAARYPGVEVIDLR